MFSQTELGISGMETQELETLDKSREAILWPGGGSSSGLPLCWAMKGSGLYSLQPDPVCPLPLSTKRDNDTGWFVSWRLWLTPKRCCSGHLPPSTIQDGQTWSCLGLSAPKCQEWGQEAEVHDWPVGRALHRTYSLCPKFFIYKMKEIHMNPPDLPFR